MRILVSGSSGLVGRALCTALEASGHTVLRLLRNDSPHTPDAIYWDPEKSILSSEPLEDLDGVVHLAGESIANGRWTAARKRRIRDSRVEGTRLLCERLAACKRPPAFLIAASAIGYYGNSGQEVVTEAHTPGNSFLAEVCQAWEGETRLAAKSGIRVVNLRLGIVLSERGGALAKMLPPFRLGLGGPLGSGTQWMSWIHLDDVVRAIEHAIEYNALTGPVNLVSPNPAINRDFVKCLGRVLKRPVLFPVPAPVLQLLLGEMADELLLSGQRVVPQRLLDTAFEFKHPDLERALAALLTS